MCVKLLTDQHWEFLSFKGGAQTCLSFDTHIVGNHMSQLLLTILSGANPVFLERGFIYIKVSGFALLILSHFSQISYENEIIWSHKSFHFHRIYKNGG